MSSYSLSVSGGRTVSHQHGPQVDGMTVNSLKEDRADIQVSSVERFEMNLGLGARIERRIYSPRKDGDDAQAVVVLVMEKASFQALILPAVEGGKVSDTSFSYPHIGVNVRRWQPDQHQQVYGYLGVMESTETLWEALG